MLARWLGRVRAFALACCVLGLPSSAFAFSDPVSFGLPTLLAGGGGRYFTGSPADGYSCKVCHQGGPEPMLSVLGLPPTGYVPGARYEIIVLWPLAVKKFASAVEITDMRGKPAGSLRLPPTGEVQTPEYCEPASDGFLAASISNAPNARQVINVPDCGSQRLRFLWTAPATDVGPAWFAGSAVWSDGEADAYHDGVTDFGRVVASPSSPAVASLTTQGCAAITHRSGAAHWGGCSWAGVVLCVRWLRRRKRRATTTSFSGRQRPSYPRAQPTRQAGR
jgi:hypothetical protein